MRCDGKPEEMGEQQHTTIASSSYIPEMLQTDTSSEILVSWRTEVWQLVMMAENSRHGIHGKCTAHRKFQIHMLQAC